LGEKGKGRGQAEMTYDSGFEVVDVLVESSVKLIVNEVVDSSI
jgi:hypothetical protein